MDEPRCTGFTKTGHSSLFISCRIFWASCFHIPRVNQTYGGVGMFSACNNCFVRTLSIATAEAKISQPTNGTLAMRNNPISEPSSPNVPCIAGKTTSIFCDLWNIAGQIISKPSSNESCIGFHFASCASQSGCLKNCRSFIRLSQYHFPFFRDVDGPDVELAACKQRIDDRNMRGDYRNVVLRAFAAENDRDGFHIAILPQKPPRRHGFPNLEILIRPTDTRMTLVF